MKGTPHGIECLADRGFLRKSIPPRCGLEQCQLLTEVSVRASAVIEVLHLTDRLLRVPLELAVNLMLKILLPARGRTLNGLCHLGLDARARVGPEEEEMLRNLERCAVRADSAHTVSV